MNCVSSDICVYHLSFVCIHSLRVFFRSRVTEVCPVSTELHFGVCVRKTATIGGICWETQVQA